MAITLTESWIYDLRNPIAGDSYNWAGTEPMAAKKSIVIHHTGVNTANSGGEDGFSIANYHTTKNGWGGIGYHFVITHDNHGAVQVQYVGDLATYRAHVANNNPGRIGICLVGNFEQEVPGQEQLAATRRLIDYLIAPNNIAPSLNFHSQVVGHGDLMATGCPGKSGQSYQDWFKFLRNEAPYPHHLYTQPNPPQPTPAPIPEPVYEIPVVVEVPTVTVPDSILANDPEWITTWKEEHRKARIRVATQAYDMLTTNVVATIPQHHEFAIAGTMRRENQLFVRSEFSLSKGTWVGVPAVDLEDIPIPTHVEETIPETPANVGGGQIDGLSPTPEAPVAEIPDRMAQIGSFFWVLIRLIGKLVNKKG